MADERDNQARRKQELEGVIEIKILVKSKTKEHYKLLDILCSNNYEFLSTPLNSKIKCTH